jgi:hypothetical protein
VGTKVQDSLRACVDVVDYCDPFSTGTLTCAKTLVIVLGVFLPPCLNSLQ